MENKQSRKKMKFMSKRNLIAYFSHRGNNFVSGKITYLEVGNTEVVAQKIMDKIGGDCFYIETKEDYPIEYQDVAKKATQEMRENARPELKNTIESIEQYDRIFIGFPNWCGTMPMAVWTFLESFDFSGKEIYAFCTHEGSGMANGENDIKKLCPTAIVKEGIAIKGSTVNECDEVLEKWLDKCQ